MTFQMLRRLVPLLIPSALAAQSPADIRAMAHSYYEWRDSNYPVGASDQGKHTWDDRIADYRLSAVLARRRHVDSLLARVKSTRTQGWSKDDRIDRILFQSQLENAAFFARVMRPEESDPL